MLIEKRLDEVRLHRAVKLKDAVPEAEALEFRDAVPEVLYGVHLERLFCGVEAAVHPIYQ